MLLTFDQAGDLLDELAEAFPPALFDGLNGGVHLVEDALPDPEFPRAELYIMGEYHEDLLGRYINLYYGSFAALAKDERWSDEKWETELYETLAHEFTHHIESLAGERGLERKDEEFMEDFWERHGR